MVIYQPYTYLIGWSEQNIFYYGSEYANKSKIANPKNLWTTYFTSSKYVDECRVKYGEPDIIQVRKSFFGEESKQKCIDWERKVLKRMNVLRDDRFLNKNIAGAFNIDDELLVLRGKSISKAKKGKPTWNKGKKLGKGFYNNDYIFSEEHKQSLRKPKTDDHKEKLKGPKSEDHKLRLSISGKNQPRTQCPHCEKMFTNGNIAKHIRSCKSISLL